MRHRRHRVLHLSHRLGPIQFLEQQNHRSGHVWPQHSNLIEPGSMQYTIETAKQFEQTFDVFSESYTEQIDRRNNSEVGTTLDKLGVQGRFVQVRLHDSGIFSDTPIVGRYPIYGAEEITVLGGLLYSDTIDIDYRERSIHPTQAMSHTEFTNSLKTVEGATLELKHASAKKRGEISAGAYVIVRDGSGTLVEKYTVR